MTYLHHVTLTTGHVARSSRAEVDDQVIVVMTEWLDAALAYIDPFGLPGPLGARGYNAQAWVHQGGLMLSLALDQTELLTFAVAKRSRQSGELWAWMVAQHGAHPSITPPSSPWCAVHLHPAYMHQRELSAWAGDFERVLAWAWLERNA